MHTHPSMSSIAAPHRAMLDRRSTVLFTLCSVALLFVAASPAVADAQSSAVAPEPTPQIMTSGRGEVRVNPDRATLSLAVETRRLTASQASQENARLQRAVFDTLKAVGVAADQLSTSDFSVMPEQRWNQPRQQQELVGYVVRNTVRVQVRQLDQLGRIIDAALSKGSNLVSSLELFASNTDAARREALARAVEQARLDAEAMAKAAGGVVAGLLELSSEPFEPPGVQPIRMELRAKIADASPETPIGTGSQAVSVKVSARWRFSADKR